ncbi:hypothetical protein HNQ07_002013 [Deinococcus metalli]|uniref:Uncharacterized protein n=1 Tax=Deinococcus metalli TaxID=1141878 RepID=A0A7W8NN61_9DEIO|nr:hypothetical protein [Deinococcus metalli]MBB5376549.1 hypothetical protein [Deinococcus metalli]GHF43190.1 hypothetical protein GCM10017781_19520 [Deinococcus metalli]
MPQPAARCRPHPLLVGLLLLCSPAAAAASPQLTLPAGAVAVLQPSAVQITGPQQRPLEPGTQVCVSTGSAGVSDGGVRHPLTAGQCYQVPAPRSLLASLVSLAASWLPTSRKAGTVNAESRGEGRCGDQPPRVALPSTYTLDAVMVPVASRPYPNTVEVVGAGNETLYRAEQARPGLGFAVPVTAFERADHIVVRDGTGKLLYRGAVSRVVFDDASRATPPAEQAQRLLETGLIDYALPAYSLLLQADEVDAATQLLAAIRTCFVVQPPAAAGGQ